MRHAEINEGEIEELERSRNKVGTIVHLLFSDLVCRERSLATMFSLE